MHTTTSIKNRLIATLLAAGLAIGMTLPATEALAQTPTTITYQGVLNKDGNALTEDVDIEFQLWDSAAGGSPVGPAINRSVTPEDGLFTETLDFGAGVFSMNQPLWLEMTVSSVTNPSDFDFFRQPLTATPFAVNTRGIRMDDTGAAFLNRLRVGPGAIDDGSGARNFVVKRDPITKLYISMQDDNTGVNEWEIGGNNAGDLLINAGFSNRIAVKQNGRIGIGTPSPTLALDVIGEIALGNGFETEQGLHIESSTGDWEIGTNNAGNGLSGNQFFIYDDITNRYMMTVQRGTGRVGIGTTDPERMLHLRNAGDARIRLEADTDNSDETDHPSIEFSQDADQVRAFIGMEGDQNDFIIRTQGDQVNPDISLMAEGNVGINTLVPAFNLHVNGSAAKPGGGSWTNTSDIRLKKNITPIDGALDTLLSLRGVHFEYKDPDAINELAGVRTGFIAQEAEKVIPDWVFETDGYKRMTIRGFEALAVEAMRELKAENEMLRERLDMLEALLLTEKSRD